MQAGEAAQTGNGHGASDARYRALFDCAPDGIVVADRDGRFIDVNPSACTMLGYSRDELLERRSMDLLVPSEIPHLEPARRTIEEQSKHERDWLLRRKDGSVFPAHIVATKLPDGSRFAMIRDISERNRTIDALHHAEERMRLALHNANVGIWDMDHRTGVFQWSETLEAQYGLTARTFPGTFAAFVERIHPDDRARVQEAVRRAERAGFDFASEHRAVWPDGTIRWLSHAGRVVLDDRGQPLRSVGISLDITEARTLEAQFQQAQKMEAVGRLAGGVAHDFNNQLTAILGYCELLLDRMDSGSPVAADIAEIQQAGTAAAGLTRQLLAFSRRQIIEPALLDLNEVVAEIRSLVARVIGDDVVVSLVTAPQPALVVADRGQLEQLILNLAVNARDAMPKGGRLTLQTAIADLNDEYVATHLTVTPGRYVALTVTDNGIGMTADVQNHLFEPFFTTKEPGNGTGLGLATVHGIVARSGGSIGVYSEPGMGTAIRVYLPHAEEPAVVHKPAPSAAGPRQETVLVVEDSDSLRELARRLLERHGYTVLLAADADEATKIFAANAAIDVVLTDVVMPGLSGPELTEQLIAQRPALKVIYMSGYTEEAIARHGVLKPGIAFLNKPFTSDTLAAKLREVLESAPARSGPADRPHDRGDAPP